LWTIVDGRVTQVGLDVRATTGTTAITTAQGLTFDGDFDLSPIGATLATWTSRNCTYDSFVSGACANLSFVDFYGALPSTVGSTIGTLDLSGCTNALVVWLGGPVTTAIALPSNLVELRIANVAATSMTFASLDVSGSDIATFFANYGDFTAGLDLSNCASLTSINLDYCSFGTLDLTTLSLDTFNAGAALFTSVDMSGIATLTSIVANAATFTSIDASGCSSLSSVNFTEATFASVDLSNCPSLSNVSIANGTYGSFTLNLSGCTSITDLNTNLGFPFGASSLNITGCTSLVGIFLPVATDLTTVTLTVLNAASVVMAGAALNVASVNAILIAADANGALSGTMDLSGGTSAAPTGAGITAKNNLIAKGWIVATN